jgi:hypothetical protein
MRRFGIEIEFEGSQQDAARALQAAGMGDGSTYPYNRNAPAPYWTIKNDGSVSSGGEMVSPVLDLDNPEHREQVTKAIMALRSAGATTCESAGIHVHIDGTTLTAEQVAAVARCFAKFEDCIYRVASSGWQSVRRGSGNYAKPMPERIVKALAKAKTAEQVGMAYYGEQDASRVAYRGRNHHDHSRYYGLNLHSWFYRKTIEFRVFNSSLNPERVQGYIGMCMAIVDDARNGYKRSVNKRYALGGMAEGTTNEAAARHRFLQVLRYDGGMALEDMERLTKIWKDSRPQRKETLVW